MRHWAFLVAFLPLTALAGDTLILPGSSGEAHSVVTYAVADLPTCNATTNGYVSQVTDAADTDDCTAGGGSDRNLCACDGSAWIIVGDGGAGAIPADAVGTAELDDGSDTPTAGQCLLVASNTTEIEYGACSSGSGDVTAVGPACSTGACLTDGVATTGTTLFEFEGTSSDDNELSILSPSANPASDIDITFPSVSGTLAVLGGNTFTGVHDFGGATSVEIPNGTGPTVNATGEIAVDTTNGQVQFFDGTAARALDPLHPPLCMTKATPADADSFLLGFMARAITISRIQCIVDPADASESVAITVQECDSTGDNCGTTDALTCDNDGDNQTTITDSAVDAGDYLNVDFGTVTGTVTQVNVCVYYVVNPT